MEIKVKYNRWETVYIKTDVDQRPALVSGHEVRQGYILYIVSREGEETRVYEQELTKFPAYLTTSDN
jgi:hypothetical protein